MMDDESLQMYFEESKEHLEDIESNLLQMEQDGANVDTELVNKVFRAAHSMKGGAGFLGLDNIKELAHKIENVLDMVRNQELVPTSEVVNVVLSAFDKLNELVDNMSESNEMDISEHIVALQGLKSANLEEEDKKSIEDQVEIKHPDGRVIFTPTSFDIDQALKGATQLYLLEYDLIHDVHRQDKKPMDVIKMLGQSGTIVDLAVDLPSVGTLEQEEIATSLPMYVLYSVVLEPDLMPTLLGVDQEKVIHLAENKSDILEASPAGEESGSGETAGTESASRETTGEKPPEEASSPEPEKQKQEAQESRENAQPASASKPQAEKPKAADTQPMEQAQPGKQEQKDKEAQPEQKGGGQKSAAQASSQDKAAKQDKSAPAQTETLRVNVNVLDQLMNLAGELVLSRNQLLQAVGSEDMQTIQSAGQRIDLVTSELQEAIMQTRMQPVGSIFNKFPRVVRDLAKELDKDIELEMTGKEVELDKAIIEGLGDPLTHLVRNSADHGLESPDEREAKGKPRTGYVMLRAYHESGQVNIEIEDDGGGMDPEKIAEKAVNKGLIDQEVVNTMSDKEKINLIMMAGLSTSDEISDVSGRGVGMDVVKSNLDKLGGQVEIDSQIDVRTMVRIKLPLTLAIIPSLLVTAAGESFAIPQVNVSELLRIGASEVGERIEKVGDAEVLMLRGELVPLLHLPEVLGLAKTFFDPNTGTYKPDKRSGLADKRKEEISSPEEENIPERREDQQNDVNIVVVHAGAFKYGLVVEGLHDSVEIVVKPLGMHLKSSEAYAGATIMGDGHVALILDVPGLARIAQLSSMAGVEKTQELAGEQEEDKKRKESLLLFENAPGEPCAVPLDLVSRVEQIKASDIEILGGKKVIQYGSRSLAVHALEELANVGVLEDREELICIVFDLLEHEIGLLAIPPVDTIESQIVLDEETLRSTGIKGSGIINGRTTLLLDVFELIEGMHPEWFASREQTGTNTVSAPASKDVSTETVQGAATILLVEDSDFFRSQVHRLLQDNGYKVVEAENGQVAWEHMQDNPDNIDIVLADLEMPVMDGFELTERIKGEEKFSNIPVIALTSLASEEDQERGRQVGIDEYQIKLDKDKLLNSLSEYRVQMTEEAKS